MSFFKNIHSPDSNLKLIELYKLYSNGCLDLNSIDNIYIYINSNGCGWFDYKTDFELNEHSINFFKRLFLEDKISNNNLSFENNTIKILERIFSNNLTDIEKQKIIDSFNRIFITNTFIVKNRSNILEELKKRKEIFKNLGLTFDITKKSDNTIFNIEDIDEVKSNNYSINKIEIKMISKEVDRRENTKNNSTKLKNFSYCSKDVSEIVENQELSQDLSNLESLKKDLYKTKNPIYFFK